MRKLLGQPPFITILLLFLLFLVGGTTGWISNELFRNTNKNSSNIFEKHESGYKYINPLLSCEVPQGQGNTEFTSLEYKIKTLIEKKIEQNLAAEASVYVRDLNNGPWIGINEDANFSPASLLKVPLMIAILKQAETDSSILQKKITYDTLLTTIPQTITPKKHVEVGKSYTVEELLTYMIGYSDNLAKDLLANILEGDSLDQIFTDLEINIPDIKKPEDFMSVKQYASFFRILYNSSYLNKQMSEKALSLLGLTDFARGIIAGVPPNIKVANKFGERELRENELKQLHDCGIVYLPQKPYLLCIMTRGQNLDNLITIIQNISELIYKNLSKK